jgi:hypothetical protein
MEPKDNVSRTIDWRELFPWTLLFRSLPAAVSLPVMLLALIGVVATPIGWTVGKWVFVNADSIRANDPVLAAFVDNAGAPLAGMVNSDDEASLIRLLGAEINGPQIVFAQLTEPFWLMFSRYGGLAAFCFLFFGCAWTILIWSFLGTAISRIAVMRYTRGELVPWDEAIRFAWSRWANCATAVGLPLIGVFVLSVLSAIAGLLMTFDFGLLIVSIFFVLILALAGVMAIILLGLAFGWPLTIAAIGTEGQDSFDAMTRAYAYTLQRPLHYIWYGLVSIVFGGLCWLLVANVTVGIENLAYWSTSWGANAFNAERIESIRQPQSPASSVDAPQPTDSTAASPSDAVSSTDAASGESPGSGLFRASRSVIAFWVGLLKSVAVAFLFAQFWCLATGIYLLLRRDVDETELDEVFVSQEQRTFDLPPLEPAPSASAEGSPSRGEAETQPGRRDPNA